MSAKAQTPLPLRSYTVQQVDDHLAALTNILLYSENCNRKHTKKRIDYWLDERNRLTEKYAHDE